MTLETARPREAAPGKLLSGLNKRPRMAYLIATLACMAVSGACSIPGKRAMIEQSHEQAAALCRQTAWNRHREAQLKLLVEKGAKLLKDDFGPAEDLAHAAVANCQLLREQLRIGNTIAWINGSILSVLMVVYVLLAWFCLIRKRRTLQQAFSAVRNIHLG